MSFYGQSTSNDYRRKWDQNEFEIKAKERIAAEREEYEAKKSGKILSRGIQPKREMLQARDYKVDLESKVGKQVVINKTTPSAETGGYYCDVCDCVVKDSVNFLDHINGKNHQRNMGFSMKVKRSTIDDVKNRIVLKKAEKELTKKDDDERRKDIKEEEFKMSDLKRQQRERIEKRKRPAEYLKEDNLDILKIMGINNFGVLKKK